MNYMISISLKKERKKCIVLIFLMFNGNLPVNTR